MQKYGYVRVSTREQNLDRQIEAIREEGVDEKLIYKDKMSGKNFERPNYNKVVKRLKRGDLLVVKSIDRLGRNYKEILDQWRYITIKKEADIKVLDMPLLDTSKDNNETYDENSASQKDKGLSEKSRNLTGIFISDLVLQILAYVAETERNFIKQRQAEGIAIAKKKGVRFGREKIKLPDEFELYRREWENGEINIQDAAKKVGMSVSTFWRRCKD